MLSALQTKTTLLVVFALAQTSAAVTYGSLSSCAPSGARLAFSAVPQLARPSLSAPAKCIVNRNGRPAFRKTLRPAMMTGSSAEGMQLLQDLLRTLPNTGGYNTFGELFSKYDLDKSGTIDAAELRTALCDLGAHDLTMEQVDTMLKSIDTNHDGQVDWEEFQNALELAELRITQEWEDSEKA